MTNERVNTVVAWLSDHIENDNSEEHQNTFIQLRRFVNSIHMFTNNDECVEFILNNDDKKVYLIISETVGKQMIPCMHDIDQLDSIFIFCDDKQCAQQWTQEWTKIKGIFTDKISLFKILKKKAYQFEQNAMPMSFVTTAKKLDQLDPSFMYTQIIKEILLTIKFEDEHILEFINHYPGALSYKEKEMSTAEESVRGYYAKTPVWWYTKESILYSMLNRALRLMDGDMITRMGFIITDLHRHLEQLHQEQYSSKLYAPVLIVYRGQGLFIADFNELLKTKGGLMSFNNFLSTSTDRTFSFAFAESNLANADLIGVLFTIEIDANQSTTPFASVRGIGCFPDEDEILFSMHSVFRIHDIKHIDEYLRLYEVNLSLTSENDKELCTLTDYIRKESFPDIDGWYRLALILTKLSQNDKAEEICKMLLDRTTNETNKAAIYHCLVNINYNQGKYEQATEYHEKALGIAEQSLPSNHPTLATSYNNIGLVYENMGNYSKALSNLEKALEILQESHPSNQPGLALSYNNIGLVYKTMGDYPKAFSSLEYAVKIGQSSLPSNHPHLKMYESNLELLKKSI